MDGLFSKTNPGNTGWMTWTFDPLPPGQAETARQAAPTPLEFAGVILPVIRKYPEAYQAMVEAIRARWPLMVSTHQQSTQPHRARDNQP